MNSDLETILVFLIGFIMVCGIVGGFFYSIYRFIRFAWNREGGSGDNV